MIQVTVAEAQKRLPELLALVETGESVEIHPESGESFVLVHKPKPDSGARRCCCPATPRPEVSRARSGCRTTLTNRSKSSGSTWSGSSCSTPTPFSGSSPTTPG